MMALSRFKGSFEAYGQGQLFVSSPLFWFLTLDQASSQRYLCFGAASKAHIRSQALWRPSTLRASHCKPLFKKPFSYIGRYITSTLARVFKLKRSLDSTIRSSNAHENIHLCLKA